MWGGTVAAAGGRLLGGAGSEVGGGAGGEVGGGAAAGGCRRRDWGRCGRGIGLAGAAFFSFIFDEARPNSVKIWLSPETSSSPGVLP
jgi:hypothetical protein